jgi:hypothetical protein
VIFVQSRSREYARFEVVHFGLVTDKRTKVEHSQYADFALKLIVIYLEFKSYISVTNRVVLNDN